MNNILTKILGGTVFLSGPFTTTFLLINKNKRRIEGIEKVSNSNLKNIKSDLDEKEEKRDALRKKIEEDLDLAQYDLERKVQVLFKNYLDLEDDLSIGKMKNDLRDLKLELNMESAANKTKQYTFKKYVEILLDTFKEEIRDYKKYVNQKIEELEEKVKKSACIPIWTRGKGIREC